MRPPNRVRGTLHTYLAGLRRALSPCEVVIERRHGGYVVVVDEAAVHSSSLLGFGVLTVAIH